MRQLLVGSRPPKELTEPYVSIPRGVYTRKIFDATLCVISYGGLDPQNN